MFLFVRFACGLSIYLKEGLIITVHLLAMSADKFCKGICLLLLEQLDVEVQDY